MKHSNIELIPLSEDHCIFFLDWISDKSVVKYSLSLFQENRDIHWVEQYIRQINSTSTCSNRTIITTNEKKPIGYCGLSNISRTNNSAEYYILIGEKSNWNKGLGSEAGVKILKEAFLHQGLNRIWLTVSEHNIGAIKSYKKIGFIEEGRMRQACFREGEYHDKIIMSKGKMGSPIKGQSQAFFCKQLLINDKIFQNPQKMLLAASF